MDSNETTKDDEVIPVNLEKENDNNNFPNNDENEIVNCPPETTQSENKSSLENSEEVSNDTDKPISPSHTKNDENRLVEKGLEDNSRNKSEILEKTDMELGGVQTVIQVETDCREVLLVKDADNRQTRTTEEGFVIGTVTNNLNETTENQNDNEIAENQNANEISEKLNENEIKENQTDTIPKRKKVDLIVETENNEETNVIDTTNLVVVSNELSGNSKSTVVASIPVGLPPDRGTSNVPECSRQIRNDQTTEPSLYHLKWINWKGEQTPIVTQNENGPCPLLAIANVLILARKIILPVMQQVISGKQLMEYIGDCILSDAPKQGRNEELILNYEQNMQDAIAIMHKLQTGIDVNVHFTGVTDFEFTSECIVFDLLKIFLYHGWLVDPQDEATVKAIQNLSYNQVVEKMISTKESGDDNATEGYIIEDFLTRTATQLTYYGLCELNSTIQDEELCVFFRNNHFSTLYKHKKELFLLVTDQGFLTEPAVVWETLNNIEGDGYFVNSDFKTVTLESQGPLLSNSPRKTQASPGLASDGNNSDNTSSPAKTNPDYAKSLSQEDKDYLIALSLQQDTSSQSSRTDSPIQTTGDSDLQLAIKLQEEENKLAHEYQYQQRLQQEAHGNVDIQQRQNAAQQQQQQRQQQQRRPQQQLEQQQSQQKSDKKDLCSMM